MKTAIAVLQERYELLGQEKDAAITLIHENCILRDHLVEQRLQLKEAIEILAKWKVPSE